MQRDGPESVNQKLHRKQAVLNQIQIVSNKAQYMEIDTLAPMQKNLKL